VSLGRLGQRELMLEAKLELAVPDPAQHVPGALHQLLAAGNMVIEARPRHEERTPRVQDLQIERRYRPARLPVEDEHATRREARERPFAASLTELDRDVKALEPRE